VPSNLNSKLNRDRAVVVLIPLLLFQLAILSVQIQQPGGITPLKTLVLSIQGPVMNASNGIIGGIQSLWGNYVWLVDARAENEKLQESVRRLNLLNRSYEEIRQENIRLRRLLSVNNGLEYDTIGARVIARTPGFLANVLYIDRGAKDGVPVDCPIVSGDGIIGRTVYVTDNQSQVQLITNPDAALGVMMGGTRTPGVLQGTGDLLMDLNYISNAEQILVGDTVLTSGLDTIFPKGFLIGEVTDSRKSQGLYYNIKVRPVVDLRHIEEVSVLLPRLP